MTINPSTGAASAVGTHTGASRITGMTFAPNGTLFGIDLGTDQLITIDTTTGATTPVGSLGPAGNIHALAYVPEPSMLVVLGIGSVTLATRRRAVALR